MKNELDVVELLSQLRLSQFTAEMHLKRDEFSLVPYFARYDIDQIVSLGNFSNNPYSVGWEKGLPLVKEKILVDTE